MASYWFATFFIAIVPTVVVVIADPHLLNAMLVRAGKLIGPTSIV
jgi:hypothetical protein